MQKLLPLCAFSGLVGGAFGSAYPHAWAMSCPDYPEVRTIELERIDVLEGEGDPEQQQERWISSTGPSQITSKPFGNISILVGDEQRAYQFWEESE